MSNFTYEIDERNLRLQMKDFTVPVKEDAWQKFETFSDSMVSQQRSTGFKSFNLNLNRSVVLPSVFAVIIILFSFLLVNFVSIKNPAKDTDQKAEASPVNIPSPANEPKNEQAAPVIVKETAVEPVATVTVADIKPEEKAMINAIVSAPETVAEQTVAATETASETIASEETDDKAKRRARRRAEAVESQKLLEIRPTPVSEEREVEEVRPD